MQLLFEKFFSFQSVRTSRNIAIIDSQMIKYILTKNVTVVTLFSAQAAPSRVRFHFQPFERNASSQETRSVITTLVQSL